MFERLFLDEQNPESISEKELRSRLSETYKDVNVVVDMMINNPEEWIIRTIWCLYRYTEKENGCNE